MLQHFPPKGIDITIVNAVIDRYIKSINTDKDTEIVGTVMVVKEFEPVIKGFYRFKAHCIVAQLDETGFADTDRHAHYDLDLTCRMTLVPCPDSQNNQKEKE